MAITNDDEVRHRVNSIFPLSFALTDCVEEVRVLHNHCQELGESSEDRQVTFRQFLLTLGHDSKCAEDGAFPQQRETRMKHTSLFLGNFT